MISIKTDKEVAIMREGGKILSQILKRLAEATKPGVTTNSLDELANKLVKKNGVEASFFGYNNFPATLCVSINDEIVHGIPSDRVIQEEDLVYLDMGVKHKGFHTDSAITVIAGKNNPEKQKLINVTKEALRIGTSKAKVGNTTADVGRAIQEYVESNGFSVPRELIGHGIGKELHEAPEVPNYEPKIPVELKPGMTIAIEPMVFASKDWHTKEKNDVFSTKDGSLSAHFEHTVAITNSGPLILTE